MLTRREKLLVRPWQLRRYNHHRKKVLTALPVIDFGPPAQRAHVTVKLKKLQKEGERRDRIEEENFKLLQRMGSIMKKNRLDNYWETKPPTFLRRVGIYHRTRSPSPCDDELTETITSPETTTRRSRCLACSSMQLPSKVRKGPEERVPWEPPKQPQSHRLRTCTTLPSPSVKFNATPPTKTSTKTNSKSANVSPSLPFIRSDVNSKQIVLDCNSLHLEVNYPLYVDVKVKSVGAAKTGQC